jgi:hypothetical protein
MVGATVEVGNTIVAVTLGIVGEYNADTLSRKSDTLQNMPIAAIMIAIIVIRRVTFVARLSASLFCRISADSNDMPGRYFQKKQ